MVWTTSIETERVLLYIFTTPESVQLGGHPVLLLSLGLLQVAHFHCSGILAEESVLRLIEFFHPKLLTTVKVWKSCDKRCLAGHELPNDRNHWARSVADEQGWVTPSPWSHAHYYQKCTDSGNFWYLHLSGKVTNHFPRNFLNIVKVSFFWDNHSLVYHC